MSGDLGQPPGDNKPADSQSGVLTTVAASLLALSLLAALVFWFTNEGLLEPPQVDLTDVSTEVAQAITQASDLVRANSRSAEAWGQLAMSLRAHDFGWESDICFQQAADLDPRDPRWPYLLGVSLSLSDVDGARNCYRRSIEIDPDFQHARLRLAELLLGDARVDEAAEQFQEVIRRAPEDPRAQLGMARVAWLRDDVEGSLGWAEKSAARAPGQRATHELLSRIYHRLQDRDAAQQQLQLLRDLPPGKTNWDDPLVAQVLALRRDPNWDIQQAQQLFNQGQVEAAISLAQNVVQRHPEMPLYQAELGRMLLLVRQLPRAGNVLERALRQHPETSELHRLRGVVHFYQQQWEAAESRFRTAIRYKPDHAEAYENLGHCLLQRQDLDAALEAFRSAIRFNPSLAEAHGNLGKLLMDRGQLPEAIQHLKMAVELAPRDNLAKQLLQEAQRAAAANSEGVTPAADAPG